LNDTKEKYIVIWTDPERGKGKEDKTAELLGHLEQYNVVVDMSYKWTPMVVVQLTNEELKTLQDDEDLIIEENGEVYIMGNTNLSPGKIGNCS